MLQGYSGEGILDDNGAFGTLQGAVTGNEIHKCGSGCVCARARCWQYALKCLGCYDHGNFLCLWVTSVKVAKQDSLDFFFCFKDGIQGNSREFNLSTSLLPET